MGGLQRFGNCDMNKNLKTVNGLSYYCANVIEIKSTHLITIVFVISEIDFRLNVGTGAGLSGTEGVIQCP